MRPEWKEQTGMVQGERCEILDLHALAKTASGRTGRGTSGSAGDRTSTGRTAGTGFAGECRYVSGECCICGMWRRDRAEHREHPYPSAKGYAGKLSGQPGERTGLRCWETSVRQRTSTSSAGIQICGKG